MSKVNKSTIFSNSGDALQDKLLSILREGTPFGEVDAIDTDGKTYINLLVPVRNIAILGYVARELVEVTGWDMDTLEGLITPTKYKETFFERAKEGGLLICKERLEWIQQRQTL